MRIDVLRNAEELGKKAAEYTAQSLNEVIKKQGKARLLLSTGQSQLTTINELVKEKVDWGKVEMFHLDEYVGLDENHKASFRRYLRERFVNKINLKNAFFVHGDGNIQDNIQKLTVEIRKSPIDVALIGIGENAHIAFNDPPADFETKEAFKVVQLDKVCRTQQVREGWFASIEEVPNEAITMTICEMEKSKKIISCVPYKVKAEAIKNTLENELDNNIPATALKGHKDWTLYLDEESASLLKNHTNY